mmetsp:Transcript_28586/g.46311  ORF Transcript_28586/g.46311 Transcript_28586/m.46311 type:complete len:992 (-) Transcript_28586:404-3379(-)
MKSTKVLAYRPSWQKLGVISNRHEASVSSEERIPDKPSASSRSPRAEAPQPESLPRARPIVPHQQGEQEALQNASLIQKCIVTSAAWKDPSPKAIGDPVAMGIEESKAVRERRQLRERLEAMILRADRATDRVVVGSTVRPRHLDVLELFVEQELGALGASAHDESEGRLRVFSACLDQLISDFRLYGPLLANIKHAFITAIQRLAEQQQQFAALAVLTEKANLERISGLEARLSERASRRTASKPPNNQLMDGLDAAFADGFVCEERPDVEEEREPSDKDFFSEDDEGAFLSLSSSPPTQPALESSSSFSSARPPTMPAPADHHVQSRARSRKDSASSLLSNRPRESYTPNERLLALQSQVRHLTSELSKARDKVEGIQKANDEARRQLSDKNALVIRLKADLDSRKQELSDVSFRHAELLARVREFESKVVKHEETDHVGDADTMRLRDETIVVDGLPPPPPGSGSGAASSNPSDISAIINGDHSEDLLVMSTWASPESLLEGDITPFRSYSIHEKKVRITLMLRKAVEQRNQAVQEMRKRDSFLRTTNVRITALHSEMAARGATIGMLNSEISSLMYQLQSSRERSEQSAVELARIMAEKCEAENNTARLREEVQEVLREVQDGKRREASLEESLREKDAASEEAAAEWEQERCMLQEEIDRKQMDLEAAMLLARPLAAVSDSATSSAVDFDDGDERVDVEGLEDLVSSVMELLDADPALSPVKEVLEKLLHIAKTEHEKRMRLSRKLKALDGDMDMVERIVQLEDTQKAQGSEIEELRRVLAAQLQELNELRTYKANEEWERLRWEKETRDSLRMMVTEGGVCQGDGGNAPQPPKIVKDSSSTANVSTNHRRHKERQDHHYTDRTSLHALRTQRVPSAPANLTPHDSEPQDTVGPDSQRAPSPLPLLSLVSIATAQQHMDPAFVRNWMKKLEHSLAAAPEEPKGGTMKSKVQLQLPAFPRPSPRRKKESIPSASDAARHALLSMAPT